VSPASGCPRRQVLGGLLGAACVGLGCGPKGEGVAESAAPTCGPTPKPGAPGWWEIPLAEHPALLEVGGQAAVSKPEAYLELLVAQPEPGCYVALWRICSHGSCDVAWEDEVQAAVCPCHGSMFDEVGAVLTGPATEPLRSFPIGRVGESLWVYREL